MILALEENACAAVHELASFRRYHTPYVQVFLQSEETLTVTDFPRLIFAAEIVEVLVKALLQVSVKYFAAEVDVESFTLMQIS